MTCDHFHTDPLRCWTCARRFWKWAENHTRGRGSRGKKLTPDGASFYECAAKFRSW
jgi:hypothetical protein